MAIPVKRFDFLNEETNVAIADFYNESNINILNSPLNDLKGIDTNLEGFLSNATQTIKDNLPSIELPVDIRSTKDALSNLLNIEGLSAKDITSLLSNLIPNNPLATSSLNSLSTTCRTRTASRQGSGRPYGSSNNCNGNNRSANGNCGNNSSSQFGSAINNATGGSYNNEYINLDALLGSVTSLSATGYDMNMCGVFGALSQNVTNTDLLSRASGSLLGGLTSSKNVLGMLDLASSSGNLKTKLFNPNAITSMLASFVFPNEIKQNDNSNLADRYTGAMELFDSNWNKSSYDNRLSTQGVVNSNMASLMKQKTLDNIYDENNLNTVPVDDSVFYSLTF